MAPALLEDRLDAPSDLFVSACLHPHTRTQTHTRGHGSCSEITLFSFYLLRLYVCCSPPVLALCFALHCCRRRRRRHTERLVGNGKRRLVGELHCSRELYYPLHVGLLTDWRVRLVRVRVYRMCGVCVCLCPVVNMFSPPLHRPSAAVFLHTGRARAHAGIGSEGDGEERFSLLITSSGPHWFGRCVAFDTIPHSNTAALTGDGHLDSSLC